MSDAIRKLDTDKSDVAIEFYNDENFYKDIFSIYENKNNVEQIKKRLLKSQIYVYEKKSEIQGLIALDGNYIICLFVKNKYRNNGVGKSLILYCKKKFWSLITKIPQEMHSAAIFFEKQAFFIKDKMNNAETNKCELCMEWVP